MNCAELRVRADPVQTATPPAPPYLLGIKHWYSSLLVKEVAHRLPKVHLLTQLEPCSQRPIAKAKQTSAAD